MGLGEPIAAGNTAKIYVDGGRLIKVFDGRYPEGAAEYEANKQRLAYDLGLPVPEVLEVTRIDGRQVLVMEYVEGPTLGALIEREPNRTEALLMQSIDVQRAVHGCVPRGALESMTEKLTRQIGQAKALSVNRRAQLLGRLNVLPTGDRLCHGDFHVYNLIKAKDRIVIIDWADASIGNPHADVYRTFLLYAQVSTELADGYLRLFCERSGDRREEIMAWAPVIAGARLSEHMEPHRTEPLIRIVDEHF